MGWLMDNLGTIGSAVGSYFGGPIGGTIGGTLGNAIGGGGSKQTGNQTITQQQQIDPRIDQMLFGGSNGNGPQAGLLSQYQGMLGQPQNAGAKIYGQAGDNYVGKFGAYDMEQARNAANGLMAGNTAAPTMGAASMTAAQVNAPSQNGLNLSGSYDKFINGDAGANPYLTKSIQGGIDQSTNQFKQMQDESTNNLMRNVLPSIRSNSVLSGQYGGSRQGIAEGNAISDFTKQQQQAATQFGQNNTNQAVGAQANSFNQGQDRALSATQGLGAQQYGVASQNATMQQQANQANANFQQSANQNNQQAQLGTNALNSANTQAGMSGLTGILNNAGIQAQNQDSYALNQAGKVNGLLTPYLGVNGNSTTSQPLYQNSGGQLLGGITAGLGMYNGLNKNGAFNGSGSNPITQYNWNSGGNDGWTLPYGESMGT